MTQRIIGVVKRGDGSWPSAVMPLAAISEFRLGLNRMIRNRIRFVPSNVIDEPNPKAEAIDENHAGFPWSSSNTMSCLDDRTGLGF